MHIKTSCLCLGTALFLAAVAGCSKSESPSPASNTQPVAAVAPAAKFHWLGKKRLSAESNATNFMAIWNLPESAKLEAQTLDKLSSAPWRLLSVGTPLSNAPTALLRSLLDDLVQQESYLEVYAATNQPGALVFAIRLDAARAALWRTNLPAVLASLYPAAQNREPGHLAPTPDFRFQTPEFGLVLSRAGDWTLLSLSRGSLPSKLPSAASLLADFAARIQRFQAPFEVGITNFWLETEADLKAFAGWIPLKSLLRSPDSAVETLPRLSMTLIGDGQNVRTRGELSFSQPIPIELEPWNIPTNLIHDPLIGFMGVRGIRPLLKGLKVWDETQFGTMPNQVFYWAQDGMPAFRFFAAPSGQASNQLHLLSEFLINEVDPHFASSSPTNGVRYGAFERMQDAPHIRWRGVPFIAPSLDIAMAGESSFITGGLFRNTLTNQPVPAELLRQFQTETNLLFYDWETTQTCESSLIQLSQLARLVFGRGRLSITNNAALPWLVAISPKLGIAGSAVRLTAANRLTVSRSSALGLTGIELHLLADWLESPSFPLGLFTLEAKPTPLAAAHGSPPPKAP